MHKDTAGEKRKRRQKESLTLFILVGFVMSIVLTQTRSFALPPQNSPTVIPVGKLPEDVAVNPLTNTIYVANREDNTVSAIDGMTNTVTATIQVGVWPSLIAVNPVTNTIYVANDYGETVSVIAGATNVVIRTIPNVPRDQSLYALTVNPATNLLYGLGLDSISVIDGKTNTIATTIGIRKFDQLAPTPITLGLAVDPTSNTIYVADTTYGGTYAHISVIDGRTNALTSYVQGPIERGALAINPNSHMLYA